ncbi:MAG TPA: carboxylesterase family protein [Terriglobales bacterium]|jgi:para-nitrobenzyl esterase
MRKLLFAAAAFQALALVSGAGAQTVKIATGRLQGSTSDGVTAYKGIPYAAPPVGNLRWEPPQLPAHWSGVRDATQYAHDCMQLPFPSDAAPLGTPPAEDCLYANVWVPAHHSGKLPVMVWIYGGGWVNGGSSPAVYSGSQFAKQGIAFLSFNYRLGRFGFFAFPELTKESKDGMLGNYGYMDIIAALKWVKQNIAAFGGDPQQVTVFGESAGGFAVHTLMTSPLAQGLFERAGVESGGGRTMLGATGLHAGMGGRPSAEQIGVAFAQSKGITGDGAAALAALRALPAESIVNNMNMASSQPATYPGPMIDGKIVVGDPQTLYLEGKYAHVPILIGANSADIGFAFARTMEQLFAPFGTDAKAAEAVYTAGNPGNVRTAAAKVGADALMLEPARFVAQTLSAQGLPAWEYRFGYVAESLHRTGAQHASEIPFVFDTVKAKYGAQLTPADENIAEQANHYWGNFAKTGDPNGPGLPQWPAYHTSTDMLMNFTEQGPVGEADPWKARLDLTEKRANEPSQPREASAQK